MQDTTNDEMKYVMINKSNGARIECTKKYVTSWLARGFEVEGIIVSSDEEGLQSK